MSTRVDIRYTPPGPVAAAFMSSTAMLQIINGPIGSGKTTACLIKAIRLAMNQQPSKGKTMLINNVERPVREFKIAIIRDTYRQLWRSTIPSWNKRVPQTVGEWSGTKDGPAVHRVPFVLADGSVVDFIAEFGALGDNDIEEFMRGYEPTAWYLNEADLLAKEVLTFGIGRAGRYPDMSVGGPSWYGILMDCNAPTLNNWLYERFFKKPVQSIEIELPDDTKVTWTAELYRQPGGRSPGAENLENLAKGYYQLQCVDQEAWYIARMIDNKPGYSRAGRPIYEDFNDILHVSPEDLRPLEHIGLGIGIDAGGSPAAVFSQRLPNGVRHVLDELVTEQGTGPIRFGEMVAQRLQERFPNFTPNMIRAWADPSAVYGADKERGEEDWTQIVSAHAGITIQPAPTNTPSVRWEAVRKGLMQLIDGKPAFVLSPRCVVLREGFNSGYRFRKLNIPGEERYSEEADKNQYSHPHDALQYECCGNGEYFAVMEREHHRFSAAAGGDHQTDWDPLS